MPCDFSRSAVSGSASMVESNSKYYARIKVMDTAIEAIEEHLS